MKMTLGLVAVVLCCFSVLADEPIEPADEQAPVAVDAAHLARLLATIEDAKQQAAFIQRSYDTAGAETPEAVSRLLAELDVAARRANGELAAALDTERPATNFEPEGPLVQRKIKPGEVIENVELQNVELIGHLAHGAVLRNVTIRNGGVGIFSSSDVVLSNVRIIGGHPESDMEAAFSFNAVENLRCHNLSAYDCQRGIYLALNVSGSSKDFLFDGLVVDGYYNWLDLPGRKEALLIHGYKNGEEHAVQGVLKNVHVRNRGGTLTIWDAEIAGLELDAIFGVTKIHFGFSSLAQRCDDLVITRAPDLQQLRFALYAIPTPAATLGKIAAPKHTEFLVTRRNTQRRHLIMKRSHVLDDIRAYLDDEYPQRRPVE